MEKKGVLRKNFIEIILLLMLIALIILATASYLSKTEGRVTKEYFNTLITEIQKLKTGEQPSFFVLYVGSGWTIKGFDKGADKGASPDSCSGASCLCLCKNGWFGSTDCEQEGYCKIVFKDVKIQDSEGNKNKVEFGEGPYDVYLSQDASYVLISGDKKAGKAGTDIDDVDGDAGLGGTSPVVGPGVSAGTELPSSNFVKAYESKAFKSDKTRKELAEDYASQKGIDPALIASFASLESGMGTNNKCTSVGKSALTGCGWPTSCKRGCKCSGDNVFSDEGQLKCTAKTLRSAYEQASGRAEGSYASCVGNFRDEEGKWKCIFCVYNTWKSGTTCDYQSRILSFYQQWKKYYADEETGETGGAA